MIVDLMRNDFGRICRTGSVVTADEFRVRRYPTVLQMTTRVMGTLRDDVELFDVLRATFPPGSVTGAPKIRATEVIREREDTPRGIYCGSVMLCEPNGDITANVAIRTLEINGNTATVGIGSGIVADSDPAREWEEVLLKAKFTQLRPRDFELYEAFRYVPQSGFQSLDQLAETPIDLFDGVAVQSAFGFATEIFGGMQRLVWIGVGEVQEEGVVFCLLNELDCFAGVQACQFFHLCEVW